MLADTYVILKEYKNALDILETVAKGVDFKKALLHLKMNDFTKSEAFLERAYKDALEEDKKDTILWFMIYGFDTAYQKAKKHEVKQQFNNDLQQ